MPHPDNSGWMSMLAGRPIRPQRLSDVAQIAERRVVVPLEAADASLSPIGALHERVQLRAAAGALPELTAEVYVPAGDGPFPVLVYFHGGCWCLSNARALRALGHRIAAAGFLVVNVDYALAPEHPFPAAVRDAVDGVRWAASAASALGGRVGPVAVAGDSAGANLAAAAITYLTGGSDRSFEDGPLAGVDVAFAAALLLYGVFDFPRLVAEPGSNVGSLEVMFMRGYLGPHFLAHFDDPLVSSVRSERLAAFPPTYLACGDEDSLLGQTLAMTARLASCDVPTTCSIVGGADHAFFQLEGVLPAATPEVDRALAWLSRTVADPPPRIGDPDHPAARATAGVA